MQRRTRRFARGSEKSDRVDHAAAVPDWVSGATDEEGVKCTGQCRAGITVTSLKHADTCGIAASRADRKRGGLFQSSASMFGTRCREGSNFTNSGSGARDRKAAVKAAVRSIN